MPHDHSHDHGHTHTHGANKRTLIISFAIIFIFMLVEAIGGFVTNSLALLSDAGHMLSDAFSLGIAALAFSVGGRAANERRTYGYRRLEILAAVLNGILLLAISLIIFIEAIRRIGDPPEIATTGMLVIAIIGLLVNILVAFIMFRGGDVHDNLNMRGAFLHVISDMLGSVGAIIAALAIMFLGWGWADPVASVLVAVLVLRSGYKVTRAGLDVLMESVPHDVDVEQVIESVRDVEGVLRIHDLHVWSITSGLNALSAHVVVDGDLTVAESGALLAELEHVLEHQNIHHSTIQLESPEHLHDEELFCVGCRATESPEHHH